MRGGRARPRPTPPLGERRELPRRPRELSRSRVASGSVIVQFGYHLSSVVSHGTIGFLCYPHSRILFSIAFFRVEGGERQTDAWTGCLPSAPARAGRRAGSRTLSRRAAPPLGRAGAWAFRPRVPTGGAQGRRSGSLGRAFAPAVARGRSPVSWSPGGPTGHAPQRRLRRGGSRSDPANRRGLGGARATWGIYVKVRWFSCLSNPPR